MKLTYTGKAHARIDGIGDVTPGDTLDVEDSLGRQLVRSGEFDTVRKSRRNTEKSEPKPESAADQSAASGDKNGGTA